MRGVFAELSHTKFPRVVCWPDSQAQSTYVAHFFNQETDNEPWWLNRYQGSLVERAYIAHTSVQELPEEFERLASHKSGQQHYQQKLDEGIEIDDSLWQILINKAANVLVESSEQSRKGAGA